MAVIGSEPRVFAAAPAGGRAKLAAPGAPHPRCEGRGACGGCSFTRSVIVQLRLQLTILKPKFQSLL